MGFLHFQSPPPFLSESDHLRSVSHYPPLSSRPVLQHRRVHTANRGHYYEQRMKKAVPRSVGLAIIPVVTTSEVWGKRVNHRAQDWEGALLEACMFFARDTQSFDWENQYIPKYNHEDHGFTLVSFPSFSRGVRSKPVLNGIVVDKP